METVEKFGTEKLSVDQFFRVGAVVRLKSGGLPMTIERVVGNGDVDLAWFSGDGKLHRDALSLSLLSFRTDDNLGLA